MMEMWLKRSTLVLLTAVAVAVMGISGQHDVILNDNQTRVYVPFGSSLTLNCRLSTAGYERFRVAWFFNPSGPSFNDTHKLPDKIFNASEKASTVVKGGGQDTGKTRLKYTLSNVTGSNSGWYFCKITAEIPMLGIHNTSGTHVVITTVSPTDSIDWWLWIMLGVFAFILIVLLVVCIWLRGRPRRSGAEDPVYANTRRVPAKQPSPRPGMPVENLKTVPSCQNLRNPSPGRRYDEGKRRHKQ